MHALKFPPGQPGTGGVGAGGAGVGEGDGVGTGEGGVGVGVGMGVGGVGVGEGAGVGVGDGVGGAGGDWAISQSSGATAYVNLQNGSDTYASYSDMSVFTPGVTLSQGSEGQSGPGLTYDCSSGAF